MFIIYLELKDYGQAVLKHTKVYYNLTFQCIYIRMGIVWFHSLQ